MDTTAYCNDGMEMTCAIPSSIVLGGHQGKNYGDTISISTEKSIVQEPSKKFSNNSGNYLNIIDSQKIIIMKYELLKILIVHHNLGY